LKALASEPVRASNVRPTVRSRLRAGRPYPRVPDPRRTVRVAVRL